MLVSATVTSVAPERSGVPSVSGRLIVLTPMEKEAEPEIRLKMLRLVSAPLTVIKAPAEKLIVRLGGEVWGNSEPGLISGLNCAQLSAVAALPWASLPVAWLICTSTLLTLAVTLWPRFKLAARPVALTAIHDRLSPLEESGGMIAAMPRLPAVIASPTPPAPTVRFRLESASVKSVAPVRAGVVTLMVEMLMAKPAEPVSRLKILRSVSAPATAIRPVV